MDALDGRRKQRRDGEHGKLFLELLPLFRRDMHSVGDNDGIYRRFAQAFDGRAAQHAVHRPGMDAARAGLAQGADGRRQRSGGGNLILENHRIAPVDIADDLALADRRIVDAALVDDRHRNAEPFGKAPDPLGAAGIGGDRDHVRQIVVLAEMVGDDRYRREVIDRHAEKTMHLIGMQIHGQYAVGPGGDEHVGHQAARDRNPRLVFFIGARVGVIGNDRRDALRRRAAQRIEGNQQFHDVIVDRRGEGLHHENIALAHVFENLHMQIVVGKARDFDPGKRKAEAVADFAGEGFVGVAGKDFESVFHCGVAQGGFRGLSGVKQIWAADFVPGVLVGAGQRIEIFRRGGGVIHPLAQGRAAVDKVDGQPVIFILVGEVAP